MAQLEQSAVVVVAVAVLSGGKTIFRWIIYDDERSAFSPLPFFFSFALSFRPPIHVDSKTASSGQLRPVGDFGYDYPTTWDGAFKGTAWQSTAKCKRGRSKQDTHHLSLPTSLHFPYLSNACVRKG